MFQLTAAEFFCHTVHLRMVSKIVKIAAAIIGVIVSIIIIIVIVAVATTKDDGDTSGLHVKNVVKHIIYQK